MVRRCGWQGCGLCHIGCAARVLRLPMRGWQNSRLGRRRWLLGTEAETMRRTPAASTAGVLIALMASLPLSAWAQTTAKPAAGKPAAAKPAPATAAAPTAAKANALGSGAAEGPLLTRDELRACLKQEESIRSRIAELEAQRDPLSAEKAVIGTEQQAVRDERAKIEEFRKVADELGVRFKAYGTRVEALNARVAEFNASNRTGASAERQRAEMNTEQAALVAERATLEAERQRLATQSEEIIRAYNAKAGALDLRVTDWNERNAKWADRSKAAESDRKLWLSSCSDRRYREDDEIAIRKEK
jgi:hypothetical protein